MTIRFAGARAGDKSPIQALRCRSVSLCAANDNLRASENTRACFDDEALVAALRHFGRYGMAAADKARDHALRADRQSDGRASAHWISIYRHFDRRMADRLSRETSQQSP